ncbi:MAG: glycosyltransferase [Deltaproteobacteria bacterium]|nr:glycosyltransferase [Deltaproteobacteria bacterium]
MVPRILTFNWHESYIHLLAKTGYEFDVVQVTKGGRFGWIREFRPVPRNCRLIDEAAALSRLAAGGYDRIVAHNVFDLMFVLESDLPKAILFHTTVEVRAGEAGRDLKTAFHDKVRRLVTLSPNVTPIFISRLKKESWGLDGEIILPGIDLAEYGGYTGSERKVLRIGNFLKEADPASGFSIQEKALSGLPATVLGLNPTVAGSFVPKDWDDCRGYMRSHRVYVNTTQAPFEDGYNLAMLEAMATGMPVVSAENPSSPIENGANGYVSADERELRARVEDLFSDRGLAGTLGQKARETVADRFPIESFISNWKRVLDAGSPGVSVPDDIVPGRVAPSLADSHSAGFIRGSAQIHVEGMEERDYFHKERRELETALESGDLESARSALEMFLEAHPLDAEALLRHSDICVRLGRRDEAFADLEKILLFEPGREDALARKAAFERALPGGA